MPQLQVGILLFNSVEVLDFAGPYEAFSITRFDESNDRAFQVHTIARTKAPIQACYGLQVLPAFDYSDAPNLDILIVPGGYGAEQFELCQPDTLAWLRRQAQQVRILASVCTGAFLLAEAGLLDGKRATTHWMDIDRLESAYPAIQVQRDVKFVDEGAVASAAGISAGIDLSLHLIERLLGRNVARATAKRMEYQTTV